jgi:hypothetical protein
MDTKRTCGGPRIASICYASPWGLGSQGCFSKSSCARRLKASAATVLSRRGAVIPHVQREQHQPLKSSPSTQMRRLFMEIYLWDCVPNPIPMGYHVVVLTLEGNLPQIPKRAKYQRCISTLSTERPCPRCVDAKLRTDNTRSCVVLKMQRFSTSREELHWCLWALASIARWLRWWGGQAA